MEFFILLSAGLANGGYYALIALGLVLIFKAQDMVQFGHGEVFMVGAFTAYTVFAVVGWPYPVAFIVAVLAATVLGMIVERWLIRPIAHMPHMTLVMVTVGLSFCLKGAARIEWGKDIYTFPSVFKSGPIVIGDVVLMPQQLVLVAFTLSLSVVLYLMFKYTALGKQMKATSQNMTGAQLSGVNIGRVFSSTWAMSAAMGGAAGALSAPVLSLLFPDIGTFILLKGFAAAVLGGFGSIVGAVVGGFAVGVMEKFVGFYISTALEHISAFVIIMLVLIFWPKGLFGTKDVTRV
ncbi:MAG: branched-chain amino acid ABC transporter permease [Arenicellales bacterium]|jgi:branched-chain amino acid transport system permease protein|nr:branched-chain amino acid ABC transporter permease [Arenicellales bacterium]